MEGPNAAPSPLATRIVASVNNFDFIRARAPEPDFSSQTIVARAAEACGRRWGVRGRAYRAVGVERLIRDAYAGIFRCGEEAARVLRSLEIGLDRWRAALEEEQI